MSRIAAGTWCADCWLKDHRCQAQILVEARPLCLPCADGEPCSVARVQAQPVAALQEDMWGEPLPSPPVIFTPEQIASQAKRAEDLELAREAAKAKSIEDSKRRDAARAALMVAKRALPVVQPTWQQVERVRAVVTESEKKMERPRGVRVSEEMKDKILAETDTMPIAQLATKHQVHVSMIYYWMKQRGIATKGSVSTPAKKPKKALPKSALVRRPILIDGQAKPGIDGLLHGNGAAAPIRISLEISDAQAVNIFTNLSSGHKQVALKAAFEALLG